MKRKLLKYTIGLILLLIIWVTGFGFLVAGSATGWNDWRWWQIILSTITIIISIIGVSFLVSGEDN